uniref:Uncharacterized protein n=1 Tax=Anopheles arabiensis TaxID=7173 RepID=A0A182IHG4_ANOAR
LGKYVNKAVLLCSNVASLFLCVTVEFSRQPPIPPQVRARRKQYVKVVVVRREETIQQNPFD